MTLPSPQSSAPLFGEVLMRLGLVTARQVDEALARQKDTGQRLGEALVSLGYVTREHLLDALAELLSFGPGARKLPLGEVLVRLRLITDEQRLRALEAHQSSGRRLGEVCVELGFCSHRQVYEALSVQQRLSSEGTDEQRPPSPSRKKSRVLVVDDSPLACALVREGLEERGFEVDTAQDGYEALEQVHRAKPAIVLTDLDMPGIDGAELCRRLKEGPASDVPVLILTANDADAQRVTGLRAGADDYVKKGASMEELAARIEGILRRTGEAERIRQLFARYTSDAVVDEILKAGDVVLSGEEREVTVLFADVRDFTGLAERLSPEQVVALLNQVLGRLADAVLTTGGTLDKFLGDGLMAVFGAPVAHKDAALRALQAARMMLAGVAELNRSGAFPCVELGVGINSGPVVVGSLGSDRRSEYTCIGDTVNVAARLCALAAPNEVLLGLRTHELAPDVKVEPLAPVTLKGKAQPVPVARLGGQSGNGT